MDDILVIFYSYTGVSRRLAQVLAAERGWAIGEVVEERPRSGWSGTWRCVLDTLLRRRPPIRYVGPPPRAFVRVVLVSPIWVYGLAGPMRSFVAREGSGLPSYVVLSTMGSRGAANAEAEIARLLQHPAYVAAGITTREVEDGSFAPRLKAIAQAIAAAPGEPVRVAELSPSAT